MKLPKSKHKLGYTRKEVLDIIRPLKIHPSKFWKKFGVNTCAVSETGEYETAKGQDWIRRWRKIEK